jgi:hypothetical protein
MAGEHNARASGWRQKRAPNDAEIERAAEAGCAVQRATALGPPTAPDVGDALTQGRLIHPQQPKDLTLAVARQNQQRCGAELWREPFHEPYRDLRTLAGVRVHQGGALLAGPPASSSTRIEQGAPAKCTDEPPAIGRAGEVPPAGLNRRKPDRLKKVLCFRPPTGGSLSLPQELGEYAWRHVALRIHQGSLSSWAVCARAQGSQELHLPPIARSGGRCPRAAVGSVPRPKPAACETEALADLMRVGTGTALAGETRRIIDPAAGHAAHQRAHLARGERPLS